MAKRKVASKDRRPPFQFGDAVVAAGTVVRTDLPVSSLFTGTKESLPVAVLHGSRPGPTVFLSGAIHGDEINGIAIIRGVLRKLNVATMAGTVIAVPVVNVFGLLHGSRYLPDRRDLNRCFPGSERGSMGSRLARLFLDKIVSISDFGIDFHTGSAGRTNLPQIRCNLEDPTTAAHAAAFSAPVMLHSNMRDGSLRASAADLGVPILLFEGGEALVFGRRAIAVGVAGTLRVLASIGMISPDDATAAKGSATSRSSYWLRAGRSGVCHVEVDVGQTVSEGQILARVEDLFGKQLSLLKARQVGVVIGLQRSPMVNRGDAILHVADLISPE